MCAPTGLVRERPPVGAVDPERFRARGLRNATELVGPAQADVADGIETLDDDIAIDATSGTRSL